MRLLPSPLWGGVGGGGLRDLPSRNSLSFQTTFQGIKHQLHDTFKVAIHIAVPDPQDCEALTLKPRIPRCIFWTAMQAAINFDHQPPPEIHEIRNEAANWRLPAEMKPKAMVQVAQLHPEFALLRCHLGTQAAGVCAGLGGDISHLAMAPHPQPLPTRGRGGAR